jgi:hypothetical protein
MSSTNAVHLDKCRLSIRCMYAGDNACHWDSHASSHPRGWWVGVWRPYHVERGDLSVYWSAGLRLQLIRSTAVDMQNYTLCATVTVLVLAMWLFAERLQ